MNLNKVNIKSFWKTFLKMPTPNKYLIYGPNSEKFNPSVFSEILKENLLDPELSNSPVMKK